ncbi:MAG: hypothetical protein M1817_003312 [Caeruleum heppii]|nr:MAG: hypothetical protein M1817_003312 [Caeruleum heppii]
MKADASLLFTLGLAFGLSHGKPISGGCHIEKRLDASQVDCRDSSPTYLFTFGDSYTDTHFDERQTLPSPGNPFGNPPRGTYKTSALANGKNWVNYLTEDYNASLILSYNYGRSAATIDQTIVPKPGIQAFRDQIKDSFLPLAGQKPPQTPWNGENSIAGIFIGINDIGGSHAVPGIDPDQQAIRLVTSYFEGVDELYQAGLRRFFFLNVPPLQLSPNVVGEGPELMKSWEEVSKRFNGHLAARVFLFKRTHPDCQTLYFNDHFIWNAVLQRPTDFGFVDNTTTDARGRQDVVWSDGYHPSEAMQRIIAYNLAEQLHQYIGY